MLDPTAPFGLFPLFMLLLVTLFSASISIETLGDGARRRTDRRNGRSRSQAEMRR